MSRPDRPAAGAAPRVADALVAALCERGVRRVYTVAGESYLALLDAICVRDDVEAITCRHEGSAAFMALADAKLSHTIGVCAVNRGPGATNASIAVHAAYQDAAPLVLLVGHVPTDAIGLDAFQELDCAPTFAAMSKGVWCVGSADAAGRVLARALETAVAGTPGPVVVMLPEDVLSQPAHGSVTPPVPRLAARPHPDDAAACRDALASAHRPLVIAGGALNDRRELLRRFCERFDVPVVASNKHQDLFGNRHPLYAGHLNIATQPSQLALFLEADVVLALGTRLRDLTTQRWRFPGPGQRLLHVHADPRHVGNAGACEWPMVCDPGGLMQVLLDGPAAQPGPAGRRDRPAWIARLRTYEARQASWAESRSRDAGDVFGAVIAALNERLPESAIVTIDAGNFTSWVHRYLRFHPGNRLLAIESSAMGFAVPSAISAGLHAPGRRVVAIAGDGGFLMTGAELATAVMHQLPILFVIANNSSYATIRAHQEREFPGRVIATGLRNPDFVKLASAYGATGFRIAEPGEVEPVLDQAWRHPGPAVLEVVQSLDHISAYRRLADLTPGGPPTS